MAGTQNSISSLVAQFLRVQKNSLEVLNGLNQATVSNNDTVSIEVLDENGFPKNANIPSYGYLKGEIQRIDNNVKALAGLDNTFSSVRNADGTYSQIFRSNPLKDPPILTNLPVPGNFYVKDNWFFESFLSPLLYVNIDVTGKIPDSHDRIKVKRVIANTDTLEKRNFFDKSLSGRNDLTYENYLKLIGDAGISYFVDDDIIPLPLRNIRFVGSFSVTSYYDDVVNITDQNGNTFQETRRNYKLNTLKYTDTTSNTKDGRELNTGDKISTAGGSIYEITSVNKDQFSIQAKKISGYEPINLGNDSIYISSTDFGPRYVQVNIGYNERQGVFFKTIDDNFNIEGSTWSTGVVFWSSSLQTKKSNGDLVSLENYYLSDVSDIGKIFLGMSKEKKIPSVQGLTPDSPLVSESNFKVVQVNKQLTDSTSSKTLNEKLQSKSSIRSDISSLDQSINNVRAQLNTGLSTAGQSSSSLSLGDLSRSSLSNITIGQNSQLRNPIGVNTESLKANLNSLIEERSKKVQLFSSLVEDIGSTVKDLPQIVALPKYRVRGFWPIPLPKYSPQTGDQSVIQFIVRYRYLSDSGSSQPSDTIEYIDVDGNKKSGTFSNWVEYRTDIRKKQYDSSKGFYVWAPEVTSDGDTQNINQLDLPINKGERIEIQISSVSEAGWPDNPLISPYSNSVIITFPDNLTVSSISDVLQKNNEDSAVVKVQSNLESIGLPIHLSQQFTYGNKTYFHDSSGISSGFYNQDGSVINLLEKITDMQNQINLLRSEITKAKGVLEIYIVDSEGNKIKVSRGSTIKLNAGFTTDFFTDPLGVDAGKIISVTYNIQLYNPEASSVELSSIIPGGLDIKVPSSIGSLSYPVGYDNNLRYGDVPISISSLTKSDLISGGRGNTFFRQAPPFASSSSYSQYLYPRYRNVGFDQILVKNSSPDLSSYFTSNYQVSYIYTGSYQMNFGVFDYYPQNGTSLIPYDPSNIPLGGGLGPAGSNVWNGSFSGGTSGNPIGGGNVSEFCIDIRHPELSKYQGTTGGFYPGFANFIKPYGTPFEYPPIRHSQCFWGDSSLNQYWVQSGYRVPLLFPTSISTYREDNMYPDKIGFTSNDEFLIGKYTCGAYLFLSPKFSNSVQVPGSTSLSKIDLLNGESNSINVPLVFQFRAVDKSGYIGGFRKTGNLDNVKYIKKIGIDISVINTDLFSFDVEVSGSYKNDSLLGPNFNSGS